MLIKGSSIHCPHFSSPSAYINTSMHTDNQAHRTTDCTAAPMTTVKVENKRHGSRGRPLAIVSSSDRLVPQPTVPPVVQLVTTSTLGPVINSKINENTSKRQPSTCLCKCTGGHVPGGDGGGHGDVDSGSCDDGALVSDFISAAQSQGKIQGSFCGRLLAGRWRSCLDARNGVTQLNFGCMDNEVQIRGLQNGHPYYTTARCKGEQQYAEADSCSLSISKGKTSAYPTHALCVPKLAQTTFVKGSAVDDPRQSTAICATAVERSCYSTTPQPTSKGRLPCLVGAKTCSQFKLIDHEQLQTVTQHISPLPRRASSAVVRKEKEDIRLCRAQVKARHNRKCIPKSFAKRVAASNWQSFQAKEFDVVTSREEKHHNSSKFHARNYY